jgi:hypothetical protein
MNEKQKQNNFEDLKQLLKLKRHEIPPPGYFNNFSGQVVSRIRAGEAGGARTFMERLEVEAPWAVSFLRIFETRPGVIGAFATSVCLLLVSVVVFSERADKAAKAQLAISEATAPVGSPMASMTSPAFVAASDSTGIVASTNPVTSLQPVATLFGQPGSSSLFQQANFAPASH